MMKRAKNKGCCTQLTSKPLCDCIECTCRSCPDIMRLLSISLKDSACDKINKPKNNRKISNKDSKTEINKLSIEYQKHDTVALDIAYSQDKDGCICESVARALKSNAQNNADLVPSQHFTGHCSYNYKK